MVLNEKRGQATIIDLLMAISVFILLVTITTVMWDLYSIRLSNRVEYDNMVIKSFQISDALMKGKGSPIYWEYVPDDEVVLIGLMQGEKRLSYNKVEKFQDFPDDKLREMFRVGKYNYFFRIKYLNKTEIILKGIPPSGKYTVNLMRVAEYDRDGDESIFEPEIVNVEFALWM